jgi:hypothetical protein
VTKERRRTRNKSLDESILLLKAGRGVKGPCAVGLCPQEYYMDKYNCMTLEVLTALKINVVTPYSPVGDYRCFRRTSCLHLCFILRRNL